MISKSALLVIPVMMMALMLPSLSAAPGGRANFNLTTNQSIMNYSYQYALCKTNFTVAFVGNVETVTKNTSINTQVTALQSDTTTLQSYISAGNLTAFAAYMHGTYDPQLKQIDISTKASIKAANLSAANITLLRSDYNTSKTALQECTSGSLMLFADARISKYRSDVATDNNFTVKLAARGLNVTNLQIITSEATTAIINPLSAAVNSSSNNAQILAALNQYCLYDGCANGTNYHLAAHFALGTLVDVANKIGAKINLTSNTSATVQTQNIPRIIRNGGNTSTSTSTTVSSNMSTNESTSQEIVSVNSVISTSSGGRTPPGIHFRVGANILANGTMGGHFNITNIKEKITAGKIGFKYNSTIVTGVATKLQAAWSDIDNATTALNQVGTLQYSGNQSVVVWGNIRAAARILGNVAVREGSD